MRAITVWLLQYQHAAILETIRTISLHKLGCFRLLSNSCWQSPVLSGVVVPCSLSILHVRGDHCVGNCSYSDTGSSTYIQGNHLGKDSLKTMGAGVLTNWMTNMRGSLKHNILEGLQNRND